MRRADIEFKNPNYAHKKIKELKDKYPNEIAVLTQNVDNMFEKAECKDVVHLHGFLPEVVCESCGFKENIGYDKLEDSYSACPVCSNELRPNIVFFGEAAPMYAKMYEELNDCEMLVVIGTSGNVINTDMFLGYGIKHSILNNLEASDAIDDTLYSKVLYKKATEAIDEITADIEEFLKD